MYLKATSVCGTQSWACFLVFVLYLLQLCC